MIADMEIATISPIQAEARRVKGEILHFVDVRSPGEYAAVHATGAKLYPLDNLQPSEIAKELGVSASAPLVILCAGGNRAKKAAEKFITAGIPHCLVVDGGTRAWETAGLPVVRGKGMISIERQVRIGAGAFVLTGVLLGSWLDPMWFFLSGLVGAGLIFAGITDWCGMGLLLAKMPWNQSKTVACRLSPRA
ncbi:MAG: rhodanese-like domain-containing protein [Verrucomicrobia bacterium]|nr:rhodanese-like domain-containing protein [Verrucomicrobiota bacterium]